MRCLTLADALRGKGAEILFVCRELPGNICDFVENKKYRLFRLPYSEKPTTAKPDGLYARWLGVDLQTDAEQTRAILQKQLADWLIVDHYALDSRWEKQMRPIVRKILAIDDLADRPHDCDLLLDQNLYEHMENRYDGLVPDLCSKLLGPRNALLRPEFMEACRNIRERDGSVRRILIFFGGSDPNNETAKALEAIRLLNRPDIAVDAVVGGANPHREAIRILCASIPNTIYHCQVANMAELMAAADLAIGAGGSTTWERCSVGLPSITLAIAENQAETTEVVAKTGAACHLGYSTNVSIESLANAIQLALEHPLELKEMGEKAAQITGGVIFTGDSPLLSAILEEDNAHA